MPNNLLSDKYVAISNIAGYYAGYYDKCSLQDNRPFEAEQPFNRKFFLDKSL